MNRAAVLVFLLAVALRLGYVVASHPPPTPDEATYVALGTGLATRGELSFEPGRPTAVREPGYPVFLAGVFTFAGRSASAVKAVQAVVGAISCLLILLVARRLEGARAALLAMLMAAGYPPFVYFTASLLRETVFSALLLAMTLAALPLLPPAPGRRGLAAAAGAAPAEGSWPRAVVFGLVSGAAVLVNSVALPVFAGYLAWLAARRRGAAAALALLACLALQAPWAVRNYLALGAPVLGSTNGGKTFWDGTGIIPFEVRGLPGEAGLIARNATIGRAGRIALEVEQDRFFYAEAWEYIRAHPARYAGATLRKFLKFWRLYPHRGRAYGHSDRLLVAVGVLSFGPVLLGSLLALRRGRWRRYLALAPPVLILPLAYTVFWSQLRYRLPVEALLIIPAAGFFDRLLPATGWRLARGAGAWPRAKG